mmetsp:Transcript_20388/g.44420  ORF Transcript_20388/g.44420 Transcript_20388/m.44420 type:complete len:548 (-) Transcript_20388:136-1779(-)
MYGQHGHGMAGPGQGGGGGGGWAPPPTDAVLNRISQEFSYDDLAKATNQFGVSNRLGEGTYGTVFRGVLRDGTEVAVKALSAPKEGGFREEVEVLSRFRHPNLVILLGFARNGRERYLVYELLPGGDVNGRLGKDNSFTWLPRLNVALDAALGLSHLHGSRPQVFHRDVKTQNILMDRNGTGKVADFGLACLAQPNQNSLMVAQTSGTIGYADPLYIRTGVVTERSEVYSMGMVLLEMITGRPPALQHPSGRIEYQFEHIGGDLQRVFPMVDQRGQWPPAILERLASMALQCTCEREAARPSFVDIVTNLRTWLRDDSLHRQAAPASSPAPAAQPGSSNSRGQAEAAHSAAAQMQELPGHAGQAAHAQAAHVQAAARMQAQAHAKLQAQLQAQRAAAAAAAGPYAAAQQPQQQPPWPQQAQQAQQAQMHQHPGADVGQHAYQVDQARRRASEPSAAAAHAAAAAWQGAPQSPGHRQGGGGWAPQQLPDQGAAQQAGPVEPQTGPGPKEEDISAVMALGFTRVQAVEAFKRCSTVEAAVDWIVSRDWP